MKKMESQQDRGGDQNPTGDFHAIFSLEERRGKQEKSSRNTQSREGPGAGNAPGLGELCCLGSLLFSAQFAYLAHAPERGVSFFLRYEPQIADGMSRAADDLEFFTRRRRGFKNARLAVE